MKTQRVSVKAQLLCLLSLVAVCAMPVSLCSAPIGGATREEKQTDVACTPGWLSGPNMPVSLTRAVGVYFPGDGNLYVIGGFMPPGVAFQHVLRYSPASNTWTQMAVLLPDDKVGNMACGVLSLAGTSYIYCIGGSAGGTTATPRVFYYDPATDIATSLTGADNWLEDTSGTILPGGFTAYANKLYIVGGFNIGVASTNQIWQFDPAAAAGAKWTQMTNAPVGVVFAPTCTIGSIVYVAGASNSLMAW